MKRRTTEEALEDVARIRGVEVNQVLLRTRGPKPNVEYWFAAWWLANSTELSHHDAAKLLGVARPRVTQILKHLEALGRDDVVIRSQMRELADSLS